VRQIAEWATTNLVEFAARSAIGRKTVKFSPVGRTVPLLCSDKSISESNGCASRITLCRLRRHAHSHRGCQARRGHAAEIDQWKRSGLGRGPQQPNNAPKVWYGQVEIGAILLQSLNLRRQAGPVWAHCGRRGQRSSQGLRGLGQRCSRRKPDFDRAIGCCTAASQKRTLTSGG